MSLYQWTCHPRAESLLLEILNQYLQASPMMAHLQEELQRHTSTRLFDWLDHLAVQASSLLERELLEVGFVCEHVMADYRVFIHPGAQLPKVVVRENDLQAGIAVKVESIGDFLMVRGLTCWIEGTPLSGYRRSCVSTENNVSLWVVERRAGHAMEPIYNSPIAVDQYIEAKEKWQTRPRDLENEEAAMDRAIQIVEELVSVLGEDLSAWLVLECERLYWQAKNIAGQVQKNRQDRLGMGWANHDHHTFRSSRKLFPKLVRLFEMLGFHCRERFYAGDEAGWGAQVMENPRSGLVLFLDLDLAAHEPHIDFAHQPIPELDKLRTVGLWCALHGDSILMGGMHHLEAQFFFEDLSQDLHERGIAMMDPFSNFTYLKQAFTHGEIWPVQTKRINHLLQEGFITVEEAEKFRKYGAVGSHLENLQRREGYKGFNQKNVSSIIAKTDPRSAAF